MHQAIRACFQSAANSLNRGTHEFFVSPSVLICFDWIFLEPQFSHQVA